MGKFLRLSETSNLFDHFVIRRPRGVKDIGALLDAANRPLRLRFKRDAKTELRGVLVQLSQSVYLLNFSLGFGLDRAVQTYGLTEQDFAPTDLAIEFLYILEAKRAVTEANVSFNRKLFGAKLAAEEQALTDTLTGLKNRRALDHTLASLIDRGIHFSTVQMDLDYFKQVNDTLGHAAGDHVLQTVSEILGQHLRAQDLIVRLGGDEFVFILEGVTEYDVISDLCRRLILEIEKPTVHEGQDCRISCSMGIFSTFGQNITSSDVLLNADIALYHAKNAGRGQFKFFQTD